VALSKKRKPRRRSPVKGMATTLEETEQGHISSVSFQINNLKIMLNTVKFLVLKWYCKIL
jgi:hypothetical protein